jgi:hypothetical protein
MPMIMFVIGCVAIMAGVVMIAFGIPISEFSFGNTLIVSGTTLATGGLVILALSTVARQLARLAEGQGLRMPAPPPRQAAESFEPPPEARPAPARVPFPPKPSPREALNAEPPMPPDLGYDEPAGQSFAPSMRNPEAPASFEDEVPLSPPAPTNGSAGEPHEPGFEAWRPESPPPAPPQPPGSYFDSMWPAKPKTAGKTPPMAAPAVEPQRPPRPEMPRERETIARAAEPRPAQPRSGVAILKSGVVDGMAYTLYVDGSIEAELPQGTLRFASIDELRSHLEKNV